jgi:hypothetical protein
MVCVHPVATVLIHDAKPFGVCTATTSILSTRYSSSGTGLSYSSNVSSFLFADEI